MQFPSIEAFIAYLEAQLPAALRLAVPVGLENAAGFVETEAKASLGHYQAGAGEFPAWEPLSDITVIERQQWGYAPDDPELVTGELRDHIRHSVDAGRGVAAVGVPSEIVGEHDNDDGDPHTRYRDIGEVALAQELGLHGLPQRSFLGLACARHHDEIAHKLADPVCRALAGEVVRADTQDEPPF